MKYLINFSYFVTLFFLFTIKGISQNKTRQDSLRIAEINKTYWNEIARTVKEGDFKGYEVLCNPNAVLVVSIGNNKRSQPMTVALEHWKPGFSNTKNGITKDAVSFRFSQRIGSPTTAHETGIFCFESTNTATQKATKQYIHFEALLLKHGEKWLVEMEYQKSLATEEEWEALK
ncbi:hypothetical protein [Flavobacterium flavipallidum]|uniref:SnoaL-like protein n=1 Tax=Flavobacterium flavipallidum TaxID=3139140 RepID=A0ABU9HKI1_9FLAO